MTKWVFVALLLCISSAAAQERWQALSNGWAYDTQTVNKYEDYYPGYSKGKQVWIRESATTQPRLIHLDCKKKTFAEQPFGVQSAIPPESGIESLALSVCKAK